VPKDIVLVGDRLRLRPIAETDVSDVYLGWLSDPAVTRFLEVRHQTTTRSSLLDYVRAVRDDDARVLFAITIAASGTHIGNIQLGPVEWVHRRATIGLLIGARDQWGRGYASEAIGLVRGFAFSALDLHRLEAGCYAENIGSIRAFEKAGFQIEAVLPSRWWCEGRFVDHVALGLVRDGDLSSRP
jgi:RimJ/RimL family protein N-acetyltransferase